MIRSVLLLTAGTAAGWLAHRTVETGRRVGEQEAARRLRETLDPTRLGRSAGEAVGDAAAEAVARGTRAFTDRLRADAPPWVSALIDQAAGTTTIAGETVPGTDGARTGHPGPGDARPGTRPSSSGVTLEGEVLDGPASTATTSSFRKDPNA